MKGQDVFPMKDPEEPQGKDQDQGMREEEIPEVEADDENEILSDQEIHESH